MLKRSFIFVCCLLAFAWPTKPLHAQLVPPDLNCVSTLGNGDIVLEWTNPANVCAGVYTFTIWGSDAGPNGPFNVVANISTTSSTSYVHSGANGNTTTWNYYITAECDAATSVASDTVDNLDPIEPHINYVTVAGGQAQLNWSPGESPETAGYIIYLVVGSAFQPIDTVWGAMDTTFTDTENSANAGSLSYTIAAIDSCENTGIINVSPHASIFLTATTQNCAASGTATWNAYQIWPGGVMNYKLYASYDGAPAVLVDSTNALTDTFPYTTANVCLYVVATEAATGYTSTSNVLCLPGNPESPVTDLYLHTATVASQGINRLFYSVNPLSGVENIQIERSEDSITFTSIDAFDPGGALTGLITFDDETALNDSRYYYYRVVMEDNCGNETTSNTVKTVLLNGYAYSNFNNALTWNLFMHELGTPLDHRIERLGGTGWEPVANDTFLVAHEEDVQELVADSGTICYVVTATALVQLGTLTDTVTSRS
ncbi:MAG TPA: hypothetical protein VEY71_08070, partial [Chitinophagales bacterium]|nr:hypothetical protein [Chitinophagales bacterium]